LALTIKNEISKYLMRIFTNLKFCSQNYSKKEHFEHFGFVFIISKFFNKITKTNKIIAFKKIREAFKRKKQHLTEKIFRNFKRNLERMMNLRKIQCFCAIKQFVSLKTTIITLNSVDLNPESQLDENFEENSLNQEIDKENWNPNKGYSFNEINEVNDWMYN